MPTDGLVVTFSYVLATHVLTVTTSTPGAQPDLSQAKAYWLTKDLLAVPAVAHPERSRWRLHWSYDGSLKVDADDIGGTSADLPRLGRDTSVRTGQVPRREGTALRLGKADARKILTGSSGSRSTTTPVARRDRRPDPRRSRRPVRRLGDEPLVRRDGRAGTSVHALGAHRTKGQSAGRIADNPHASQRRRLVGRQWAAVVEERGVPLSGDRVRAVDRQGGDERRHRPVLARALTTDSTHSVAVDLNDPAGSGAVVEDTGTEARSRRFDDLRTACPDFSINDTTVPAAHRGTYLAFADEGNGTKHLRSLASAGLNTVHLLPTSTSRRSRRPASSRRLVT